MTPKYRMLDLFAGRLGWTQAFLARGWEVIAVDLVEPPEVPENCCFIKGDIMDCSFAPASGLFWYGNFCTAGPFDFICASSPCEEFSVHGMKHFHPNPKYPENGIRLFNHTREICEASGVPYVMENVRAAQQFVGRAVHHCGPFYLWGTGVPAILNQGIRKGVEVGSSKVVNRMASLEERREYRKANGNPAWAAWSGSKARQDATAAWATIPPELSNAVADYAERLLEQKQAGIVACHERTGS